METLVWMAAGGALGWVAYNYLGLNEMRGVLASIAIGVIGALIGAKAIAPIFMAPLAPSADFNTSLFFFAAGAAAGSLLIGNFVYRRWGV
jgi:uncharacterized membrane protein YeaQ/YmgE (transglycosylase-associated protein family)